MFYKSNNSKQYYFESYHLINTCPYKQLIVETPNFEQVKHIKVKHIMKIGYIHSQVTFYSHWNYKNVKKAQLNPASHNK